MKKEVKYDIEDYLSEWCGEYGAEEWAVAKCPFCGQKCKVFLRDTAGQPDAERFTGTIGLMNDGEFCGHLTEVGCDYLVFEERGRAEIDPSIRY